MKALGLALTPICVLDVEDMVGTEEVLSSALVAGVNGVGTPVSTG